MAGRAADDFAAIRAATMRLKFERFGCNVRKGLSPSDCWCYHGAADGSTPSDCWCYRAAVDGSTPPCPQPETEAKVV
jgi:hypothetical protein